MFFFFYRDLLLKINIVWHIRHTDEGIDGYLQQNKIYACGNFLILNKYSGDDWFYSSGELGG